MNNLIKRAIVGLLYVIVIFFCTTNNPYLLIGLMAIFTGLCLYEFVTITNLKDIFYLIGGILVSGFVLYYYGSDFLKGDSPYLSSTLQYAPPILFLLSCITIFFSPSELEGDFAKATIIVTYITAPFAIALSFPKLGYEIGNFIISKEVFLIFLLIWVSDTFAYLIGSWIGKHKLAPKISEKKSWEGFIGGVLFTILGGYIIHQYSGLDLKGNWIAIGIIVAISAPIGDLVESKLKRTFNQKDSSHLIPGHGGFLDRLDSFIFTSPMIYTYFLIEQYI